MAILCLQELQEEEILEESGKKFKFYREIDNFILLQQLVTDNFPKTNYSRKLVSFSVLRNSYKVLAEQFKVLVEMQLLKRYFPYKELLHRYFRCFSQSLVTEP